MQSRTKICGFGAYVPEKILSNADFEKMVDTSDEWIVQRTGIHERRIASSDEFASDLAIKAVEDLIARTGVSLDDVDQIIVTTFTPDCLTPSVASLVQAHFGMSNCGTFDISAGCTGFVYALSMADALISSGQCSKVLTIASETISRAIDYSDRTTCILFGDAAAACLLEKTEEPGAFLGRYFHTDGALAANLTCTNHANTVLNTPIVAQNKVQQNGQQVYRYVMQNIPKGMAKLLSNTGLALSNLDWFVPHSANLRMIQTVCDKLPFPLEKTLTSLEYYGNTSSVSIPLALWIAQREGKLQPGQLTALYGFGAGLTHGGVLIKL